MQLSPELRRFLLLGQTIAPFVINALVNGAIAWAVYRGLAALPLWGDKSIGGDALVTSFLLPLIICLIVTPLIRAQAMQGKTPTFHGTLAGWLRPFQRSLFVRSIAFGVASTIVLGALTVALLTVLGVHALTFNAFIVWKALYAGALAAIVTPMMALVALADR
jgi:hypothetical protein